MTVKVGAPSQAKPDPPMRGPSCPRHASGWGTARFAAMAAGSGAVAASPNDAAELPPAMPHAAGRCFLFRCPGRSIAYRRRVLLCIVLSVAKDPAVVMTGSGLQ